LSDSGAQTKSLLAAQSDCYKCHWSYPHVAYDIDGLGAQGWPGPQQPVDHSGFSTAENWGHIYYLMRSPLLVNGSDYRPWGSMGYDDPMLLSAIQYTCGGGTSGLCHFDGHVHDSAPTPSPAGTHTPLCTGYCHKPAP